MKTENFTVKWRHDTYTPNLPEHLLYQMESLKSNRRTKRVIKREMTECIIAPTNRPNTEIKGVVKRHYKDPPNRRLANKLAFKHAVSQLPNKQARTELWEGYKNLSIKCITC